MKLRGRATREAATGAEPKAPVSEPVTSAAPEFEVLRVELEGLRLQVGAMQIRATQSVKDIREAEFRVFSQFGEDGIIQWLVKRVAIDNDVFVEFGVDDYRESNTRFLLMNDNWQGLIIDAGDAHRQFLRGSQLDWRHEVEALTAFIDRENINGLIADAGIEGDIGLLSIDLDGNDYWVLEAIEVVSPRILLVEYNSIFGPEVEITIPYDPAFDRNEAHHSGLYFGASLAAIAALANQKGYALVAGSRAGGNAFFVRRDVLGDVPELSVNEAYAASRFRESRGPDGALTLVSDHRDRIELIRDMPVLDLRTGAETTIGRCLGLASAQDSE